MVRAPGRLAGAIERMDLPHADPAELHRALRDLARINRWFGGTRLVLRHLAPFLGGRGRPVRILDVGTGVADVPRAIARWARRRALAVEIEGLDHNDQILALAREAGWKGARASRHALFRLALARGKPRRQIPPENPQSTIRNPK